MSDSIHRSLGVWVCSLLLALPACLGEETPAAPHDSEARPARDLTADVQGAHTAVVAGPVLPLIPALEGASAAGSVTARVAPQVAAAILAEAVHPQPLRPGLPTAGKPGDVRLVAVITHLPMQKRWVVPELPVPPFSTWHRWFDEHKKAAHCSLDWMDEQGQWWHTELRSYNRFADCYRVGAAEFPGTGVRLAGIFIAPGRTDPEKEEVVLDEKIECDYHILAREARLYGRNGRDWGEAGTGGNGRRNVGLGGPAFKPSQNSNTYISYLLRQAGVTRAAPPFALGWDTVPRFPYSADATPPEE